MAKNSDVKESPIQTEAIGTQSPLRDGITGHPLCKISQACSLFLRTGNEVTCHAIVRGFINSRQRTIRVWKFLLLN